MIETLSLQRTNGKGYLSASAAGNTTVLRDMAQSGAAKIRLPKMQDRSMLDAVMINTAGGLTGGDFFEWDCYAKAHAHVRVTTQACEKVYRSSSGAVEVSIRLHAGKGARLEWLPQETILFDRSRLCRKLTLNMAHDSNVIIVEPVIFGRRSFGETEPLVTFLDQWRIFADERLVHAEALNIKAKGAKWLANPAGANGSSAFATLLILGSEAEAKAARLKNFLKNQDFAMDGVTAAVSHWKIAGFPKAIVRIAAVDGYALRKCLTNVVALTSHASNPPRMWLQ